MCCIVRRTNSELRSVVFARRPSPHSPLRRTQGAPIAALRSILVRFSSKRRSPQGLNGMPLTPSAGSGSTSPIVQVTPEVVYDKVYELAISTAYCSFS